MRSLTSMALTTLLASACFYLPPPNDDIPRHPDPANFPPVPAEPGLQVLILGDWGTGGEGQREVAEAIARTHAASPPDLVLTVGDNFYPDGVRDVADPLWDSVFREVYTGPFWDSLVFHPTLGNHDYNGVLQAQVSFSSADPRWDMPGLYYAFRKPLPGSGSALFLALDTNPLENKEDDVQLQLEWADSVLEASTDAWVVAYGHHPLASGGRHGVSDSVREALDPLFLTRADLYLAGHNHSVELLEPSDRPLQAVCGAGGGLDNPYRVRVTPSTLAAFTNGGWCVLSLWPDRMAVELYDRGGGLQYRHLVEKRR